jgi:hypothetical protein
MQLMEMDQYGLDPFATQISHSQLLSLSPREHLFWLDRFETLAEIIDSIKKSTNLFMRGFSDWFVFRKSKFILSSPLPQIQVDINTGKIP